MILVGDIGGTKIRFALVEKKGRILLKEEEFFLSSRYDSFEGVLRHYLKNKKKSISQICLGVAGPVLNGRVKTTNLPWTLDAKALQRIFKVEKIDLLNDLEATCLGISLLEEKDYFVLQKGRHFPFANAVVIAAGTGLGEAGLFWRDQELFSIESEGGHADFSPMDFRDWELFCDLKKRYGHVSFERILSREGILSLFSFLQKKAKKQTVFSLNPEQKKDVSKMIIENAVEEKDAIAKETLLWFCSLYGREAGNLALKFLSLGGVYIAGGIAPHIVNIMKESSFVSSFLSKGRFSGLLRKVPIKIILNERAPLLGAAYFSRKN
jgi:glucokinase